MSNTTATSSAVSNNTQTGGGGGGATVEEQLTSLISSSEFSVPAYLNLALSTDGNIKNGGGGKTPVDQYSPELQQRMAELALQLQLQTQACHEDIGRIGAELQAILPRCAADVGRIGVGLEGMRIDAKSLLDCTSMNNNNENNNNSSSSNNNMNKSSPSGGEQQQQQQQPKPQNEVSSSLETLSTLHALQSNLSRTREILNAAATWDSTLSSVAPLLAQQNLTEAVNALAQLESGERALRGMPHPEERHESIAKIRQQVQVLLQPQLKHALQNMNTRIAPLQQCVSLYMKLGKMDALKEEYVKNRPAALHKAWFSYAPSYNDAMASAAAAAAATTTTTEVKEQDPTSSDFLNWLPSWYDAVLSLIAEERRQSSAVFGHELVPEMIVKVLKECFRPILPSFQSRLESLFSSNVTTSSSRATTPTTKGSLQSICAVYESTLQFLSLIYESVASGWLDMTEAGFIQGGDVTFYRDITDIFVMIASPFHPYQRRLSELESKHSVVATQLVAKDIQEVVRSVVSLSSTPAPTTTTTTLIMALQDATDRLKGLSTFVFPLAEDALGRFELLNGGYRLTQSLSMIDSLLAKHAEELATAVTSLSNAMTADEQQLVENFDDQHVLCALEVLKIAGSFRRNLKSFESKTRERLTVLCERMMANLEQEKMMKAEIKKGRNRSGTTAASSSTKSSLFSLPDSLSVVEIDSFLTRAIVCDDAVNKNNQHDDHHDGSDEKISPSLMLLQSFITTASAATTETTTTTTTKEGGVGAGIVGGGEEEHVGVDAVAAVLYPKLDEMVKRLASSCHNFVFTVCSAVPYHHLSNVSTMSAWKERAEGVDSYGSYGILPQQYITHVGEHMLALVQALEPFASDVDALSMADEVMEGVRHVSLPSWRELVSVVTTSSTQVDVTVVETLMGGKDNVAALIFGTEEEEGDDDDVEEEGQEDDEAAKASATFCNAWLDVVGLAVSGRLLERIMCIPHLTPKGCEHLSADLNYLINVFSALGLPGHPHPLLIYLAELAMLDNDALEEQISKRNNNNNNNNPVETTVQAIEQCLARMKGGVAAH